MLSRKKWEVLSSMSNNNKRKNKMSIDIILGHNIYTVMWINDLRENKADYIIGIDYDCVEEFQVRNGIFYMPPNYAREYIKKFDTVNFYKSLYAYPGMQGSMTSLYKKDTN